MKNYLLPFFFLFVSLVSFSQISEVEKQALIDLYQNTNGDTWNTSWDLSKDVSTWQGVSIENNQVVGIKMLFNNLDGTIPTTIGNLTNLRVLELSFNKLTGTLPESLGKLSQLEVLAFNGNFLTGSIPASIGSLTQLKELHLSSNKLSGSIPVTFTNLSNIVVFNVFDNALTGEIPLELASGENLEELIIAENNFINTATISMVLLSKSGNSLDLDKNSTLTPPANSVIAIETEDEN